MFDFRFQGNWKNWTCFSICYLGVTLFAAAQELQSGEKTVDMPPMTGPGVDRVGSSGIPVPKMGNANAFKENRFNKDVLPMGNSKNTYESTSYSSRLLYLNGVNISQIKNQELNHVNVRIDANGTVYIDAPQYEVVHKQNYHPLLPTEVPKMSKAGMINPDASANLPQGTYSKDTGLPSSLNSPQNAPQDPKNNNSVPTNPEDAMKNEKNLKDMENKDTSQNENNSKPVINPPFPKELAPQNTTNPPTVK